MTFEPIYTPIEGVSDFGSMSFSSTAPYITYTPSAEVSEKTVKFNIKASAEGKSVTGDFVWTVTVGQQPTPGSSNANLSSLSYTFDGGAEQVVPDFQSDITEYDVWLPIGSAQYKTITLTGTVEDENAQISGTTNATSYYSKSTATITVKAENNQTKTYTVNFIITPPDTAPYVSINSIKYQDGDTVYLEAGKEYSMISYQGSGTIGYDKVNTRSRDMTILYIGSSLEGTYPALSDLNSVTLEANRSVYVDIKWSYATSTSPDKVVTLLLTTNTPPDADYTKVNEAIGKIPADLTIYTEVTVKALNNAQAAVVPGKNITEQTIVDGYATAIEDAIDNLVYKDADYTKVNEALDKIPSDLTSYTDETVQALKDAQAAVVRGKNITEQTTVDGYAEAIEAALAGLVFVPKIIEGNNQMVMIGEDATFKSNANFEDFLEVLLDGMTLDPDHYVLSKGSIVVTLKSDFVKTLEVGKHTLSIVSTTGSADTTFTITKTEGNDTEEKPTQKPTNPETGDDSPIIPYAVLMLLSVSGLVIVSKKLKAVK